MPAANNMQNQARLPYSGLLSGGPRRMFPNLLDAIQIRKIRKVVTPRM